MRRGEWLTGWFYPRGGISPCFVLVSDEGDELGIGLAARWPSEVPWEGGLPVFVGSCIAHGLAHVHLTREPCVEVAASDL